LTKSKLLCADERSDPGGSIFKYKYTPVGTRLPACFSDRPGVAYPPTIRDPCLTSKVTHGSGSRRPHPGFSRCRLVSCWGVRGRPVPQLCTFLHGPPARPPKCRHQRGVDPRFDPGEFSQRASSEAPAAVEGIGPRVIPGFLKFLPVRILFLFAGDEHGVDSIHPKPHGPLD